MRKILMTIIKEYLGDAVYVTYDGFHLILTTEDGIRATNEIYLEPSVLKNLQEYINTKCQNRQNRHGGDGGTGP